MICYAIIQFHHSLDLTKYAVDRSAQWGKNQLQTRGQALLSSIFLEYGTILIDYADLKNIAKKIYKILTDLYLTKWR